ncbi:MAG: hypothetical protein MJ033_07950 [Victivallaceae bacterium]|nr:hypothetical protein [Victivallaceae bacterium]
MKLRHSLILVMTCCCMTACQSGESTAQPNGTPIPVTVNVMPVAVPVAPAQRGFGPAPLRPHFTEYNSNHNVKLRTQTPYPAGITPAYQREVVTLTDAAMNGTAGVQNIVIRTTPFPAQQAPVQPVVVHPYTGW